jgi:hypothetical protein
LKGKSFRAKWLTVVTLLLLGLSYKLIQDSRSPSLLAQPSGEDSPYPVSPSVHVDDPAVDPLDPKTFPREVANSLSYARYAVGLSDHRLETFKLQDDASLIASLKTLMQNSPVLPSTIKAAYEVSLTEGELLGLQVKHSHLDPNLNDNLHQNITADQKRYFQLKKRFEICQTTSMDHPSDCCTALLVPQLLLSEEQVPAFFSGLNQLSDIDYSKFQSPENSSIIKFLGTRDWLAVCSNVVSGMPQNIEGLKQKIGNYHTWKGEFHPLSIAKQRGRRIYRLNDPAFSIAETLDDQCNVRETEVILTGAANSLQFAVYDTTGNLTDFSDFPSGGGRLVTRKSPDICLGCHLKFDSREFNVRIPSFTALRLSLFSQDQYHNSIDCAKENEAVFWDLKP